MGFASLALQVSSVDTGACEARVTRRGLFGGVRVEWSAGYPPGQSLSGFRPGVILPGSGKVLNEELEGKCCEMYIGSIQLYFETFWKDYPL